MCIRDSITEVEDRFGAMVEEIEKLGDSIGVKIKCQKEEIFTSMHRI